MYINICKDIIINLENIIVIFNIVVKMKRINKELIDKLYEKRKILDISNNNLKSFIIYKQNNEEKGILSNISSISLGKKKKIIN